MGFDNILQHDGFAIAATGMIIVFVALTLISLFIYLLPKVLGAIESSLPSQPEPLLDPQPSSNEEEVAAAIGFTLHHAGSKQNQA